MSIQTTVRVLVTAAALGIPHIVSSQPGVLLIPKTGSVTFKLSSASVGDITLKGTSEKPAVYKYRIRTEDGKVSEGELSGTEITIKDKEDATVSVTVGEPHSLPSATWKGTYDRGDYIEFAFRGKMGRGKSRSMLSGTLAGTFPGMPTPANPSAVAIPASFAPTVDLSGTSVPLLGGRAKTGPIKLRLDPAQRVTGTVNLRTGRYTARVHLLMDAPNFHVIDQSGAEQPVPITETVTGIYKFK